MENINAHKEWIIKLINSCSTPEQLDSCQVVMSLFFIKLKKHEMKYYEYRATEDNIWEAYLAKEATILII